MPTTEPTVTVNWTNQTLPADETARLLRLLFDNEPSTAARGEAA